MVNATGWAELIAGQVWNAPFVMYNTAMAGLFIFALYLVFQAMIYYKTRSASLSLVIGLMFTYVAISLSAVPASMVWWLILLLVVQGTWVFYYTFFK